MLARSAATALVVNFVVPISLRFNNYPVNLDKRKSAGQCLRKVRLGSPLISVKNVTELLSLDLPDIPRLSTSLR